LEEPIINAKAIISENRRRERAMRYSQMKKQATESSDDSGSFKYVYMSDDGSSGDSDDSSSSSKIEKLRLHMCGADGPGPKTKIAATARQFISSKGGGALTNMGTGLPYPGTASLHSPLNSKSDEVRMGENIRPYRGTDDGSELREGSRLVSHHLLSGAEEKSGEEGSNRDGEKDNEDSELWDC
jgi:hypothetical protein